MRILFVHVGGGSGGPVMSLAETLAAWPDADDVHVAVPGGTKAAALLRAAGDHTVHALPGTRRTRRGTAWSVRRSVRSLSPVDVVVANTVGALPALALVPSPVRQAVWLRNSAYGKREQFSLRWFARRRTATVAIAPSRFALDLVAPLHRRLASMGAVVPDPVEVPPLPVAADRREPFTVGVVTSGRSSTKGADIAVRLVERARSLPIRWRIFGLVPQHRSFPVGRQALDALSQESAVELVGRVPLREHWATLDAVVIVSRRESFGRVAAEAMAAGLPVIAPRHTALPETVGPLHELLYEPGDVDRVLDRVHLLASDEPERRRLGDVARQHVLATFDPPAVAARARDLLMARGSR